MNKNEFTTRLIHIPMVKPLIFIFALLISLVSFSQTVNITVDVLQNRKPVSPYLYGKNNSLSDDPGSPLSVTDWQRLKDAGIRLFRENSGNNATKYNWRLKLTSAPDWYNNVYPADWDFEAQSLQQNIPGTKGMYAFQLIGKVASSAAHNFNDWDYNYAQWWPGVNQNLAGGGTVNTDWNATKALVEGNTNLYLKDWPADSTVAILDKWFGTGQGSLNLDQSIFQYWNMDNEPEIWAATHDDVMPLQLSAEAFMQRYFSVAKKARAKFPEIKLVGFVPCSEWFWYAYYYDEDASGLIDYEGESYTWLEFFIKRIAEEQTASGIRLLDVIDLHTYFNIDTESELLQAHRIYYDETWAYSGANGLQLLDPGSDNEYIFGRVNDLLNQYLGLGHGVTLGTTESGWNDFNQMPLALNYASTLGVFANEGVELFTPWFWSPSYWEVVHLFSKYCKNVSVKSTSSDDNNLSAYSTVSVDNDSLTIVLINRNATSKNTQVSLSNFSVTNGLYPVYTLEDLPNNNSTETFVSHTNNALELSNCTVAGNSISLSLPAYSITSVILFSGAPTGDYLGVSTSAIDMVSSADTVEFNVSSNISWTAISNQSWLSINPRSGANNGTITAIAMANRLNSPRSATITISGIGVANQIVTVTQAAAQWHATEELVIYNDNETLIESIWNQNGTLSQITSGAYEGTKHYRFNYSYTNWWAGFGLTLTNGGGEGSGFDFTGYDSLKFACKLTGPATANLVLVDANTSNATDNLDIDGISNTYHDFSIPLTSFSGMKLDDVGEIFVNISGNSSSGSGTFNIDNIRLGFKETIPFNFSVEDTILTNGNEGCFNAQDTLTIAGGVTQVEFMSGSSVNLLAGLSIIFLPGFSASEGSQINASIVTDGTFCDGASANPIIVKPVEKSLEVSSKVKKEIAEVDNKSIKVFPNPNKGQFTIAMNNFESCATICIYNMLGDIVFQTISKNQEYCEVYLPRLKRGIYIVKITGEKEQVMKKITVN